MYKIKDLIAKLESGAFDSRFKSLYNADDIKVQGQRLRYANAVRQFGEIYGEEQSVSIYSAPGRTEIGGNHTDHNNGVVMAAAVNLDIIAVVSKTNSNCIKVKSHGFDNADIVNLENLVPVKKEQGRSASLIRGVAAGIKNENGDIGGLNVYTTSDVLRGSGLSSSAAFEVVIGAIINGEYNNFKFTPVKIAQISQYAENVFFGKPSGLMDQTASSVGRAITIDFKNPNSPVVNGVDFNLAKYGFSLCITDTKGSHADLTDDYAAIRAEMESVAAYFGKSVLREVDENEFFDKISEIRKTCSDRAILRAIHFFADCKRAAALSNAVKEDRFNDFLSLIIDGGHSSFEYNQNAYSIKNPSEQGVALGCAISQRILNGKGAWRLQGGGFAGTIQAFVPNELVKEYRSALDNVFGKDACYVLSVRNYGAIRVEE
ncbi:MAG: galactokinase family protein [Oscillospiraceae bacterium]